MNLSPGIWRSDAAHSSFMFTVPHRGLSRLQGRFREFSVELTVDDQQRWSRCSFEVSTKSVDTNDIDRDNRIRSMDYFDVHTYPKFQFLSDDISADGEGFVVSGGLTINGTTHIVEFYAYVTGPALSPDGPARAGISATARISRSAFALRSATHPLTLAQPDADLVSVSLELEVTHSEAIPARPARPEVSAVASPL